MPTIDPPAADRKTALAPDLSTLPDRAARAWTERMAVRPLGEGRYAVDSESGATYVVDLPAGDCSCPDHRIREQRCKHLRRVAIEVTAGRVLAPGRRRVQCAACGRETTVDAAADPPLCCPTCALDPGDRVVDAETDDTLVVYRLTDRRADAVTVAAADCTVAEYPTNEGYPADDLVVECVYPDDATDPDARTYAFPRSRLREAGRERDREAGPARASTA
jgi:hypothetical protein